MRYVIVKQINEYIYDHHHKACPEAWPCRTTHFQVSIFGLLPGRVYFEVDRFQIILHYPQPGATGATSLALPSEGGFVHGGLHYQLGVRVRALASDVPKNALGAARGPRC